MCQAADYSLNKHMDTIVDCFGRRYLTTEVLTLTRRVSSSFLRALPIGIEHFDAHIYAVVKRQPGKDLPKEKWGIDVRLDPCVLNWGRKLITIYAPLGINVGIQSFDDLHPDFFEAVEAAFLALIHGAVP